ncbi:DUF2620 domain-containing protein [Paraclostridium bifermentans]|uniref:DUF2620 domain-containing protein n=1 Tax=Paraclostridium bifermentans TaxID=1490 RepID=UPI00214A842F|nr:DUF2620 domain-containing protein [Paraclostridium bifermentans]MCR1875415.1 DUF2620 domain-containing protein [Paraclostridium bifermentans]MDV8108795.1 DUF2620 domain-containing protein [Bacillus sp. BAU-SS-2023]
MIRIVVGGQMDKERIAKKIEEIGKDKITIEVKTDLDAAMAMKTGQADYYFGACNTGGGGALAMAIALVGMNECLTASMPGTMLPKEDIVKGIENGKKAFGFTPQHADEVIEIILEKILG